MESSRKKIVRNRASQRGTAMMEALMVNMIFIIVYAGFVFFQVVYSARMRGLQNARVYAWVYAKGGCKEAPETEKLGMAEGATPTSSFDPGGDTSSDMSASGNPIPSTGTSLDNDPSFENAINTSENNATGATGTVNATTTVKIPAYKMLGIDEKEMESSAHVQCNPIPADNIQMQATAIQAASNLANW